MVDIKMLSDRLVQNIGTVIKGKDDAVSYTHLYNR